MKKKILICGLFTLICVVAIVAIIYAGRTGTNNTVLEQIQQTVAPKTLKTYTGQDFTVGMPVTFEKLSEPVAKVGTDPLPEWKDGDDPLPTVPLDHITFALDPENPQAGMINFFLFSDDGLKLYDWEAQHIDFTQYREIATFMTNAWVGDEVKFHKGLPEGSIGKNFIAARDGQIVYVQMIATKENRDVVDYGYQTFLGTLKLSSSQ